MRAEAPPAQQSLELATATEVLENTNDEDLEIEVADLVSYAPLGSPDKPMTVRIISVRSDRSEGLISEATLLAQALMGATVGDEVVLRVPNVPAQTFVVTKIVRPGA